MVCGVLRRNRLKFSIEMPRLLPGLLPRVMPRLLPGLLFTFIGVPRLLTGLLPGLLTGLLPRVMPRLLTGLLFTFIGVLRIRAAALCARAFFCVRLLSINPLL